MTNAPSAECCPKFDPVPWDGQTVTFENRLFLKKTLPQLFHMPLPGTIGNLMTKAWAAMEAAGAKPADTDFLWLCYDPSPWKAEHYLSVTKEVPGYEHARLSGTFLTKVFDGPYNHVPRWIKEMDAYADGQGKKVQRYYFYYTTCPKCAKKYGHNYVVVFAQV
jgi:hypothetical protein